MQVVIGEASKSRHDEILEIIQSRRNSKPGRSEQILFVSKLGVVHENCEDVIS